MFVDKPFRLQHVALESFRVCFCWMVAFRCTEQTLTLLPSLTMATIDGLAVCSRAQRPDRLADLIQAYFAILFHCLHKTTQGTLRMISEVHTFFSGL